MTNLKALNAVGQSPWLAYLKRSFVESGKLATMIGRDGLKALTSNRSILEKAISDGHRKVAAAKELVEAHLASTVNVSRSEPHFLDITYADANKGAVVRAMGRRLNLPRSRIASIGDMRNDILMIARSGFSIAMGNASPEVKGAATAVTGSNEQDGFAEAVHKFVLGPKARKLT